MYAVVVNVSIAAGQLAGARKAVNEQVIPRVKQAPGFVKGYWTVREDSGQGTSITVFRTKEDADNAATMGSQYASAAGRQPEHGRGTRGHSGGLGRFARSRRGPVYKSW